MISAKKHYNMLIDENNDPVLDTEPLKSFMDKWDGKIFIDKADIHKTDSVLEIGVGTGRIAMKTAPLCKKFTGIDFSEKTAHTARKHLGFSGSFFNLTHVFLCFRQLFRRVNVCRSRLNQLDARNDVSINAHSVFQSAQLFQLFNIFQHTDRLTDKLL